jgi:hypothetical protein
VLITSTNQGNLPINFTTNPQHINAVYADYVRGKLHLSTEFRHNHELADVIFAGTHLVTDSSDMGWFGAVSYRLTSRLEIGAYNSRYYIAAPQVPTDPNANHIFDQVATARFDLKKWWNVKLEGHFIDGYGDLYSSHGFYLRSNPAGTKPSMDMLVLRTAFTF